MSTPPIAVDSPPLADRPLRHVLGISGGKDSAALAIYLSRITNVAYYANLLRQDGLDDFAAQVEREGKIPEIKYFFTDTGEGIARGLRVYRPTAGVSRQENSSPPQRQGREARFKRERPV